MFETKKYFVIGALTTLCAGLQAQTLLSDFSATVDGWSGTIAGNTPFANGSTAVTRVDNNGNFVLNLSDAGFGGGASRTYSNLSPENQVITVVADMRIVSETNNLSTDAAFGIKLGSGTGTAQQVAYSKSRGTTGADSNQTFVRVAASVFAGNTNSDVVAVVTPDKFDWSVATGTWVMQLDNVYRSVGGTVVNIDTFDSSVANWSPNSASNSPYGAGSSSVAFVSNSGNGAVRVTDGGFSGGAVGLYTNAISTPGVHTVLADVRIVTDPNTLTQARIAAAPGTTTNPADLSWSTSFATASDDSGQAFATVAVPVETSGPDDLAIYVAPSLTSNVASGSWEIQVDNIRMITNQAAPVSLSEFSLE